MKKSTASDAKYQTDSVATLPQSLRTLTAAHKLLDDLFGKQERRTKRCNGAAVATFLAMVSQLPPPADRQRSVVELPKLRITSRCETVSALLTYKDQGFWVSNGINDALYEILVAMTRNDHPDVFKQLDLDESLMGGRFVGGYGFAFDNFEHIFGGSVRFEEIVRSKWGVIDDVCQNERCSKIMQKVFRWAFWMMDGGRCNYDLKPHASWRIRCRALIYCCSLGFIDVAPDRSEHPSIHELADEPPPDGHRSVQ